MIYKTFFGKYIDLSKLVFVSDAYFETYKVHFELYFQILDVPIVYTRDLTFNECGLDDEYELAISNLQSQVNEIIKAWEDFKNNPPAEPQRQRKLSRHELAAMAMQGFCSRKFPEDMKESWVEWASSLSYELADEIIKQGNQ